MRARGRKSTLAVLKGNAGVSVPRRQDRRRSGDGSAEFSQSLSGRVVDHMRGTRALHLGLIFSLLVNLRHTARNGRRGMLAGERED